MKRIFLNLKIAMRSLLNFKLRTALAILGVFLGTFSLVVVSNLSDSLSKKTEKEAESLGKNLLIVRSGIVRTFGTRTRLLSEATTLTVRDAKAIIEGSPSIRAVSPASDTVFPIRHGDITLTSVVVTGVTPNYTDLRNFHVKEGNFITADDNRDLNRVVVLGSEVAEKLFGYKNPLGQFILIYRVPCEVVGVMESKGVDISGFDQDYQVLIPLNTFLRRFVNRDYISSIAAQALNEQSIATAKAEIEGILRKRHKIQEDQKDDFTVIDLKDVMALKTQATSMITVLGRIASATSFFIGGIGILSIMILIVNERRVEIGIRRAVGSRKRDITLQFLIESAFISFSGGAVGLIASLVTTVFIFIFSGLPFTVSPAGLVISFIASTGVGILAGIYPSKKATRIQLVDVIRQ